MSDGNGAGDGLREKMDADVRTAAFHIAGVRAVVRVIADGANYVPFIEKGYDASKKEWCRLEDRLMRMHPDYQFRLQFREADEYQLVIEQLSSKLQKGTACIIYERGSTQQINV